MKIAIVGGGVAGNVAARLLAQEHDVTLFEAGATVGGHARSLDVVAFGHTWRVDTGFMVFNERTYPNFCRLLRLLGIEGVDADMSLSVSCERTGLEYQGSSLNGLFAQRRNLMRPAFLGMLRDILRFNRESAALLATDLSEETLGSLLRKGGYGAWFKDKYLVPMTAAIWSCPPDALDAFPAHFLLGFLRNHGLLQVYERPQWKTVVGKSRAYVERLVGPLGARVRVNCPVASVQRHETHVVVAWKSGPAETFDRVVLACHADQALALLADADAEERTALASIPYHANDAVLHTDVAMLPRRSRAWASWNYRIPKDEAGAVAVTYDLSRLQRLATPSPILLTLNPPAGAIDPARVLDRHRFRHPGYSGKSLDAQERLRRLNGARRTLWCGAWNGYGFHEDGVASALEVTRHFGLGLESWKAASTKASFATSGSAP